MNPKSIQPASFTARGLERLADGSKAVTHRVHGWLSAGEVTEQRTAAVARRAALAGVAVWTGVQTGSGILLVAVPAWLIAAWRHGQFPPEPDPHSRFIDCVRELIDDRAGIHLDELQAVLNEGGLEWDRAQLRSALKQMGIPVRQSVRVGNLVRTGIHRDDLRSICSTSPPPEGDAPRTSGKTPSDQGS